MLASTAELVVTLLTNLLPLLGNLGSGSVGNIIKLLEEIIPVAVKEAEDLVAPIQNIIAQIQGSGAVTSDQLTALAALDAQIDAEFDAAAKSAGV